MSDLYVCENCRHAGPMADFQGECRPGFTHGRLTKIASGVVAEMKTSFHNAPRDAGPNAERMIDELQARLRDAEREANRLRGLSEGRRELTGDALLAAVRLLDTASAVLAEPGDWDEGSDRVVAEVGAAVARLTGAPPDACAAYLRQRWEDRDG